MAYKTYEHICPNPMCGRTHRNTQRKVHYCSIRCFKRHIEQKRLQETNHKLLTQGTDNYAKTFRESE